MPLPYLWPKQAPLHAPGHPGNSRSRAWRSRVRQRGLHPSRCPLAVRIWYLLAGRFSIWCPSWHGLSLLHKFSLRGSIRQRYNIEGGPCADFWTAVCCTPCELTQESQELDLEERSYSKVWKEMTSFYGEKTLRVHTLNAERWLSQMSLLREAEMLSTLSVMYIRSPWLENRRVGWWSLQISCVRSFYDEIMSRLHWKHTSKL